jgi:hypothetical protein
VPACVGGDRKSTGSLRMAEKLSLDYSVSGLWTAAPGSPVAKRFLLSAHTRRSGGCAGSTQACLTGPVPVTAMTAGSAAPASAPS